MYARDCTPQITGAAIKAHRQIGPGLLESAYEACLAYELNKIELSVQRQKPVPLIYGNVKLDCGFRADLVVNGEVVVEIKCKDAFHPVDQAQLLSRLRLLDLRVGLLINFHVATLKEGIKRMVNNSQEAPELRKSDLHVVHGLKGILQLGVFLSFPWRRSRLFLAFFTVVSFPSVFSPGFVGRLRRIVPNPVSRARSGTLPL